MRLHPLRTATASAALSAALALATPGPLAAQAQYRGIPFAPYEFYDALIQQSKDANFSAIEQSIAYLGPLFGAIQERLATDARLEIEQAIAGRDATGARAAVLRLVFLDLKLNLEEAARAPSAARRKELLQMAYTDYYFLSHDVARRGGELDRALRDAFKQAYRAADRGRPAPAIHELMDRLSLLYPSSGSDASS